MDRTRLKRGKRERAEEWGGTREMSAILVCLERRRIELYCDTYDMIWYEVIRRMKCYELLW
jgi:hypothetical protein